MLKEASTTARILSSLAVVMIMALGGCDGGPPEQPPQCLVDEDCGFESQLCRDRVCVDRDTTLHAECCACLAAHACLQGGLTERGCSDNLDRAQTIDVDATCLEDENCCAQACDFLRLP